MNAAVLLVDFLRHHVRPINHSCSEIKVNGARTARLVDDGNHVVVVVESNLADVSLVCEQQRRVPFHSSGILKRKQ